MGGAALAALAAIAALAATALASAQDDGTVCTAHLLPPRSGASGELADALGDVISVVLEECGDIPRELTRALDGVIRVAERHAGIPLELVDALDAANSMAAEREGVPEGLLDALEGVNAVVREHRGAYEALEEVRNDANAIVTAHAGGSYAAPDYPIVRSYVDWESARLAVVMHEMAGLAGMAYTEGELQGVLYTDVGISVLYGDPPAWRQSPDGPQGAHPGLAERHYLDNCLPVASPGYRAVCVGYAGHLGARDPHPALPAVLFSEDFESGLAPNWVSGGSPGWGVGHPNDGHGPAARLHTRAAEAGPCDDACTITMRDPVDMSGLLQAYVEFWRYVDSPLVRDEYLVAQVHRDGEWITLDKLGRGGGEGSALDETWRGEAWSAGDRDGWTLHRHTFPVAPDGDVRLRFTARVDGPPGSAAIDDVRIGGDVRPLDDRRAPDIGLPLRRTAAGVFAGAFTGDELRGLADDMATMYHMGAESDVLRYILPGPLRAAIAPGAPTPLDVLLLDDFGSGGLEPTWVSGGGPGWEVAPAVTPDRPLNPAATVDSCDAVCSLTLRAPVDLSGHLYPDVTFSLYAGSLLPGEYIRAQVRDAERWTTVLERRGGDAADGEWVQRAHGVGGLAPEIAVRFVTNVAGPQSRVAVDDVAIRGVEGAFPADYSPARGGLTPEAMGEVELWRLAGDLASLHLVAEQSGELRSHLPRGVQEAMGLGPFEYEYSECYLRDCPDDTLTSRGWNHESYLRSEGADLAGPCRRAHDGLTSGFEWVDAGAYWDEFMHLCGKWSDADRVVEEFERALEGHNEFCGPMIGSGWRLGAAGDLYHPGWDKPLPDPDPFYDVCMGEHDLEGFLRDWDYAGL